MSVQREEIVKLDDGCRAKITVTLNLFAGQAEYRFRVEICQPRKRTWVNVSDFNDYIYRGLSLKDRTDKRQKDCVDAVGLSSLVRVSDGLWQSLKPNNNSLTA